MSSAVAPLMATTEQMTRPMAASVSSGSMRSRSWRGTSGGGGSDAGWMGVTGLTGSEGGRVAGLAGVRVLVVPALHDGAHRRRRSLRAEPALLDGRRDDDRPRRVGDEAHVPGLVAVVAALGG